MSESLRDLPQRTGDHMSAKDPQPYWVYTCGSDYTSGSYRTAELAERAVAEIHNCKAEHPIVKMVWREDRYLPEAEAGPKQLKCSNCGNEEVAYFRFCLPQTAHAEHPVLRIEGGTLFVQDDPDWEDEPSVDIDRDRWICCKHCGLDFEFDYATLDYEWTDA